MVASKCRFSRIGDISRRSRRAADADTSSPGPAAGVAVWVVSECPGAIRSSRSEVNRARKKRARASARIEGVPSPSSRTGQSLILPTIVVVVVLLSATPRSAFGQTDEIQVYDASHADPGVFNLTWHNNFTPAGLKTPAFPGANVADRSFNGVTEWAYGVTPWFEAGLYLPLYSVDKNRGATIDGFKLRALFT